MKNMFPKKLFFAMVVLGCTACSPMVTYHGFNAASELSGSVKNRTVSKQEVLQRFGPPSLEETKSGIDYAYYIAYKKETIAFLTPDITERKVIALSFENSLLKDVQQFKLKDGEVISVDGDKTPVYGKDLNMIQQMLSNVGRFNSMGTNNQNDGSVIGRIPGGL